MPRKAPDKVIEHRISLSNFERDKILEELSRSRENRLYASAINQVGAVAGSSLLLYGLGLYLGLNLFKDAKDAIFDFVDNTSTTLADVAGGIIDPTGTIMTTAEAEVVRSFYDRLDEAIVYHRQMERANSAASAALLRRLQAGEITLDEFKTDLEPIKIEADDLDQLRVDILTTKRKGQYYIKAQGTVDQAMGQPDWRDVVTWGAGWSLGGQ